MIYNECWARPFLFIKPECHVPTLFMPLIVQGFQNGNVETQDVASLHFRAYLAETQYLASLHSGAKYANYYITTGSYAKENRRN